jgi:pro-kumamolisin-like protein/Big-like domain-containing protein
VPALFRCSRSLRLLVLVAACTGSLALAQTQPNSRITQPINDQIRVSLNGNVHPLAQSRYDQGAVPDSFPAERMFLLFQRSPEREAALKQFLQDAHTPGSASYHKWISPEQFGQLYGPEDAEIAAVTAWLQSHGFAVSRVTKGKAAVEFSGQAGQVKEAFHTEIHSYVVNGEVHHANNRDPEIPVALAAVVAGISPMNDFRAKPQIKVLGKAWYNPKTHVAKPDWTIDNSPAVLALAPGDFAVQYDLNPLYGAGINGNSVNIGIIGASNVYPDVVADYRSFFGLPASPLNVVIDGMDPGPSATIDHGNWAELESFLDVEVSGAVAPGATINLYTAADTTVQSGLLLAAQRAVDDNLAAVLSTSYGQCEQDLGAAGNQFWAALWEQAAAQGQTSFVSAGDNGSADCDSFTGQGAQDGLAVSGLTSTPWNISVGGTDFYYSSYNETAAAQSAQLATYWNMTPSNATPATSLLGPIPEQPWNDAFGLNLATGGVYDPSKNGVSIVAGSGGASSCTSGTSAPDGTLATCSGGYAKPTWQSGKGVPVDGARDIPDVSLFAADGANGSFYPICLPDEGCTGFSGYFQEVTAVGGTSASSPAMAGILALVNQKYGRQGQANFILYALAAQQPAVFHDVAIGSNDVPCQQGSSSCTLSTLKDNTNDFYTLGHYYAGPGYDQATGLGSVDGNMLVQYWNSVTFTPTATALNMSQTTFTHGTPISVSVAVTGNEGTPTGDVGFLTTQIPAPGNTSLTDLKELTLADGAASATVNNFPGGQYQLTARYTGDTVFATSSSTPVTLNVAPEASSVMLSGNYWNNGSNSFVPVANGGSYPYGTYITMDAQPVGASEPQGGSDGIATGTVTFSDAASSGNVGSGVVNVNVKGIAEWQPSGTFPVSSNSVSASYSGDASFNAGTSAAPLTFTISKALTYGLLSASPSHISVGSPTTLSLFVAVPYSGPPCLDGSCTFGFPFIAPPTGTATFSLGSTVLGTAPVVANVGASGYAWATLSVSGLPLGTDVVTANYSGDANYGAATSTSNVAVEQAPTLTASANPSTVNLVEYTSITATVGAMKGLAAPTGSVSFAAPAGGFNWWIDTETLVNGTATSAAFVPGARGPQTLQVSVSYSGDNTYGPLSMNVPVTVTSGTTAPFTLSGTAVTIAAPGATTGNASTITATPGTGFQGSVYLSCALTSSPTGASDLPTCSVPSGALTMTGTSAVSASMTISSTAPSSSASSYLLPAGRPGWSAGNTVAAAFVVLLLAMCAHRRQWKLATSFLILLAVIGGVAACGGGSGSGGGGGGVTDPGTTAGSYTFTVKGAFTANGPSQAQNTVTVTIQ